MPKICIFCIPKLISYCSIALCFGSFLNVRWSVYSQDKSNEPGAGIYGQINLPTELLSSLPTQQLLSAASIRGQPRQQTSALTALSYPNYYRNPSSLDNNLNDQQKSSVQDLINKLSAALMRSFTQAVASNSGANSRQYDFTPQSQNMLPYYMQPQTQSRGLHIPRYEGDLGTQYQLPQYVYNNVPSTYKSSNNPYDDFGGDRYMPIEYRRSLPYTSSNGIYGGGLPHNTNNFLPISRSQNQFGYGVNAGVYAGTYGSSSASSTPDGGPPTSYGGLSSWPFLNSGSQKPFTNYTDGVINLPNASSGSVIRIPISEATGSGAVPSPQQNRRRTTNIELPITTSTIATDAGGDGDNQA